MASISTDKNGSRLIQFVGTDKRRRSIRLGKIDLRAARDVAERIEALNVANIAGLPMARDLAEWLTRITDWLYAKLEAVGLVPARASASPVPTLGKFVMDFLAKRDGASDGTLLSIRTAANRLTAHFGDDAPLDSITPGQADDWLVWMTLEKKYAPPTISRTVKHAKRIFRSAERLKIIASNPFADLRAGRQTNEARKCFVSQPDAYAVLSILPDVQWRLIFALSRFGGLRCPSEHLRLTWPDVDWVRERIRIDSPKTGERFIPIFAELRPYLSAARGEATEAAHVITRRRASAQRWGTLLERILAKVGIARWPKIFHNLRASRQTELTARYSIGTVCRWMGNSIEVADGHYLTALDAEYADAARFGALQKAVQTSAEKREEAGVSAPSRLRETLDFATIRGKQPGGHKSQGEPEQPLFSLRKQAPGGVALQNAVHPDVLAAAARILACENSPDDAALVARWAQSMEARQCQQQFE
jgi:integrase